MTLRYVVSDGTRSHECDSPEEALFVAASLFPGLIVSIEPALSTEDKRLMFEALEAILADLDSEAQ